MKGPIKEDIIRKSEEKVERFKNLLLRSKWSTILKINISFLMMETNSYQNPRVSKGRSKGISQEGTLTYGIQVIKESRKQHIHNLVKNGKCFSL